ncbi:hypothetical protein DESC_70044 [Desulfosarcina cetonica]|nr:hypothetical protein DESC_70044 [Desulfosarcina cetonica]
MDDAPSQNEQSGDHEQGGSRRQDRSAEGFIHAFIQDRCHRLFVVFAQVLANPVKDDDRIVQGVTDDGEQRRDDGQGELLAENRKEAHGDGDVMDQGHDGAHGVLEFEKPENDQGNDQGRQHEVRDRHVEQGKQVNRPHDGTGHDSAFPPFHLESTGNVDRDEKQGVEHGKKGLFAQVLADLRADHLHPAGFGGNAGGGF